VPVCTAVGNKTLNSSSDYVRKMASRLAANHSSHDEETSNLSHQQSLLPEEQPCKPSLPIPSSSPLSTAIPLLSKARAWKRDSFLPLLLRSLETVYIYSVEYLQEGEERFLCCSN